MASPDRFTKVIDQLGKGNPGELAVRLCGIRTSTAAAASASSRLTPLLSVISFLKVSCVDESDPGDREGRMPPQAEVVGQPVLEHVARIGVGPLKCSGQLIDGRPFLGARVRHRPTLRRETGWPE